MSSAGLQIYRNKQNQNTMNTNETTEHPYPVSPETNGRSYTVPVDVANEIQQRGMFNISAIRAEVERIASNPKLSRGYVTLRGEWNICNGDWSPRYRVYTDMLGFTEEYAIVEQAIESLTVDPQAKLKAAIAEGEANLAKLRAALEGGAK
jgi:hypothetical protein